MGGDQTCIVRVTIQHLFSCIKKLQPICSIVEECSLLWRIWSGTKKIDLCFWLCVKGGRRSEVHELLLERKMEKVYDILAWKVSFFLKFYFGVSSQSSQLLFFIFFFRSPPILDLSSICFLQSFMQFLRMFWSMCFFSAVIQVFALLGSLWMLKVLFYVSISRDMWSAATTDCCRLQWRCEFARLLLLCSRDLFH